MEFMEHSTLQLEVPRIDIEHTAIFRSKAIKVNGYKDLGTWDQIRKLLSKSSEY